MRTSIHIRGGISGHPSTWDRPNYFRYFGIYDFDHVNLYISYEWESCDNLKKNYLKLIKEFNEIIK